MNANKAFEWLKKYLCYIGIVIVVGIYFLRTFIEITDTGKTLLEILADGAIIGIVGYIVSMLFHKQGIVDGESDAGLLEAIGIYKMIRSEIDNFIDKLGAWCVGKNQKDKESYQREILYSASVTWDEFVTQRFNVAKKVKQNALDINGKPVLDKKGKPVTEKTMKIITVCERELFGEKKRAVRAARRAKMTPLTDNLLATEARRRKDPHSFGRDVSTFNKHSAVSNMAAKVAFAVLFGYFTARLIEDFSWASAIWAGLQIIMFLGFGIFAYYNAKFFMATEYKGRYEIKTKYLQEFKIDIQHNAVTPQSEVKGNG